MFDVLGYIARYHPNLFRLIQSPTFRLVLGVTFVWLGYSINSRCSPHVRCMRQLQLDSRDRTCCPGPLAVACASGRRARAPDR